MTVLPIDSLTFKKWFLHVEAAHQIPRQLQAVEKKCIQDKGGMVMPSGGRGMGLSP